MPIRWADFRGLIALKPASNRDSAPEKKDPKPAAARVFPLGRSLRTVVEIRSPYPPVLDSRLHGVTGLAWYWSRRQHTRPTKKPASGSYCLHRSRFDFGLVRLAGSGPPDATSLICCSNCACVKEAISAGRRGAPSSAPEGPASDPASIQPVPAHGGRDLTPLPPGPRLPSSRCNRTCKVSVTSSAHPTYKKTGFRELWPPQTPV